MASDFYTDSYSENLDALFAKKGVAHGVRRLIEAGIAAIHDDDDGALAAALDEMPINIDFYPVSAWPAGDSLLSYAARLSAPRCVTLLLSQGATLDLKLEGGDTALLTAVMQTPVVWESMGILKAEGGVSKAAVAAATRDRMARALDVLKRILGAGAAIDLADSDGYSPLLLSGHFGAPEFMSVLLDASAEVDQRADNGWTPLAQAASDGRLRCVELLVGAGAALDCGGLANAAGNGHGGCVKLLLAAGAGADCLDPGGQTSALWKAAKDGHLECVQLLLASGADAGLAVIKKSGDTDPIRGPGGGEGTTPFFMACQNGHLECAQLLLEAGAPVDKLRDFDGFSPLLIALCNSNRDCARLCVRAGADVNRVVRGGVTPLLVACQLGLLDACQLLSAFGASRAATPLGTPDQCAVHHKRADVAAWLAASRGPKWTHYVRNGAQVKSWLPLQHLEAITVERARALLRGGDDPLAGEPSALERARVLCSWGESDPTAAAVGSTVTIHSLVSRLSMNGKVGVVVSANASTGRFGVQVAGEAKALALRPANLQPAAEAVEVGRLILKAAEWSPQSHELFPEAARKQAVEVMRLGYLIAWDEERFEGGEGPELLDCWRSFVVPKVVEREDRERELRELRRVSEKMAAGAGAMGAFVLDPTQF